MVARSALGRRLGRLASPRAWRIGLASLAATWALRGLREETPLDRIAGPWEAERGREPRNPGPEDVSIPRLVAGLPFFFYPLFPRTCLRRSLVLYRHLLRLGQDPELWVGLRKDGERLGGHAWVRLEGRILGEPPARVAAFSPLLVLRGGRIGRHSP